ncbi:MAG TPA: hypothetical protein VGE67_19000, partial [Haloferula sp.]
MSDPSSDRYKDAAEPETNPVIFLNGHFESDARLPRLGKGGPERGKFRLRRPPTNRPQVPAHR